MKPKNTICLWFVKDAQEAARFYAVTFPDSKVTAVHEAPGDYPGGKKGDVLTVEFTVLGIPCLGLNGGPVFRHSEAFSFVVRNPEFCRFRQTKRVHRCAPSIRTSPSDSASEPLQDTAIVFANRPGKLLDLRWLFQGQLFVQRPDPADPYAIRREIFDLGASHPTRQLTRLQAQE